MMDCPNCGCKLSAPRFYISGENGAHRLCRDCEQYFKEPPRKRTVFSQKDLDAAKTAAYKEGMLRAVKIVDDTRYLTREGTKDAIREEAERGID